MSKISTGAICGFQPLHRQRQKGERGEEMIAGFPVEYRSKAALGVSN
jgi:hypothetical protein